MIEKRPSILIYTFLPEAGLLREICAGIEEEGVFYELKEQGEYAAGEDDGRRADGLARQAAAGGMLDAGIGISRTYAVLQMKGMKPGSAIEAYEHPTRQESRKLGANSARAIKKMPFID